MSNCTGPNPSPINLSQSTAQPCTNLCDLVMDDAYATDGLVVIDTVLGLGLFSRTNLGSCKFNGEGYSCEFVMVTHPSRHTIENIQADAEIVAHFKNPTGKILEVSSLIRVNPAETQASRFLNTFIPYGNPERVTKVTLNNWSLSMMVPPNATFYSYQGTDMGCTPTQNIVFGSMINIDSNAFAILVKNTKRSVVGIQPLGKREVYFNNGQQLPGPSMPNDGKIYMRLRPTTGSASTSGVKPVTKPDISTVQSQEESKTGTTGAILQWTQDQAAANGWFSILNLFLILISLGCAIYFAYLHNDKLSALLILNDKAREFGRLVRSFFFGVSSRSNIVETST